MKRTALITGGTRGIGLAIARHLSETGFHLALNGIREEPAVEDALSLLGRNGSRVKYYRGSIADAVHRERMMEAVRKDFGRLDVLVNNAGMGPRHRKDILETTEESFLEVLNVNLTGAFFLSQKAARWMIRQKQQNRDFQPCIVNISSISAEVASVNRGEYCISKAGVSMMTKLFAARLGEYDIPVYEIMPGIIQTDMTAGSKEKYDRMIGHEGLTIERRWGQPEDVGLAVRALVGGNIPYATGQVLNIDGGLMIQRL